MARSWFSTRYYGSPMPYSIFFHKGYAIHGTNYISRLGGPASHGCVRMPMTGVNPARWFYDWIDLGTPVTIADQWPGEKPRRASVTYRASAACPLLSTKRSRSGSSGIFGSIRRTNQ